MFVHQHFQNSLCRHMKFCSKNSLKSFDILLVSKQRQSTFLIPDGQHAGYFFIQIEQTLQIQP